MTEFIRDQGQVGGAEEDQKILKPGFTPPKILLKKRHKHLNNIMLKMYVTTEAG